MKPVLSLTALVLAFSLPALGATSLPANPVTPATPVAHAELDAEPAIATTTGACPSTASTGPFTPASFAECLGPCFGGVFCPERQFCTSLGCFDDCCWYECW